MFEDKNEDIKEEKMPEAEEQMPEAEEPVPAEEEKMPEAEEPKEPEWVNPNERAKLYMQNPPTGGYSYNQESQQAYQYNQNSAPTPKKKNKTKTVLVCAAIVLVCAIAAGAVFGLSGYITRSTIGPSSETVSPQSPDIGTTDTILHHSENESSTEYSVEDIVESCLPSVVSITNRGVSEIMTFFGQYQQESLSSGTGIIIGKNDTELLIVTNYHVVADSKELTVIFDHDESEENSKNSSYMNIAHLKGYDADKDVAVIAVNLTDIKSDTMDRIAIATLGSSKNIRMGSSVIAIGNALGYGQSTTRGIISAVDREITVQNAQGVAVTNKYIQTDAAINEGNSGGALLNMKGEVIGINSAKISSTGVEGMGYAIPISDVEELIGNLMNMKTRNEVAEESRGYLGITGDNVSSEASEVYGIPVGAIVTEVAENSPAEKAGIRKRDVIVKVDGMNVSTMQALSERLAYYAAGETVPITVMRPGEYDYEEIELKVKLGSKEEAGID